MRIGIVNMKFDIISIMRHGWYSGMRRKRPQRAIYSTLWRRFNKICKQLVVSNQPEFLFFRLACFTVIVSTMAQTLLIVGKFEL